MSRSSSHIYLPPYTRNSLVQPHTLDTMASTYTGFKSSVAAAADMNKPTVAQTLTKHADLPISPPSSAGSDVDAAELEKRYTEDYNGQYRFAPIKEHIVSRGMFSIARTPR